MNSMPTNPDRVFTGLTPAQADGLACVRCGADYLTVRVPSRPVGRSETDSQVFACADECADRAEYVADTLTKVAAELAADEAYAKAFPTTPCPEWCAEGDGHEWTRQGDTSVGRAHSREFYRTAAEDDGFTVTVDQWEEADEDGTAATEPPRVSIANTLSTTDVGMVIRAVVAVLGAAELLRALQGPRQDIESLMNIIRAGA